LGFFEERLEGEKRGSVKQSERVPRGKVPFTQGGPRRNREERNGGEGSGDGEFFNGKGTTAKGKKPRSPRLGIRFFSH